MMLGTVMAYGLLAMAQVRWRRLDGAHSCRSCEHTGPGEVRVEGPLPASGRVIGMTTFGVSAPLKTLQEKLGFELGQVVASARELLRRHDPIP